MHAFQVPIIDISGFEQGDRYVRDSLARIVDDTFTTSGFMVVVNHGIPGPVIADAKSTIRSFFAQPNAEKLKVRCPGQMSRGYFPHESIASGRYGVNQDAPPDLMESFAIGAFQAPTWASDSSGSSAFEGDNIWPEGPANFRTSVEAYYLAVERMAERLMRLFARALRVEEDYFLPYFTPYNGVLRLNLYGKLTSPPLPGQLRIGEHTDLGGFTILNTDSSCGGLQIRDSAMQWHDVEAPENSFVINIGELMQAWTNDRWRATCHRVVCPRTDAENVDRLSIPFFANPDPASIIRSVPTCLDPGSAPRHAPFESGEFRKRRMLEQQGI